jgi:hypothetical protein
LLAAVYIGSAPCILLVVVVTTPPEHAKYFAVEAVPFGRVIAIIPTYLQVPGLVELDELEAETPVTGNAASSEISAK